MLAILYYDPIRQLKTDERLCRNVNFVTFHVGFIYHFALLLNSEYIISRLTSTSATQALQQRAYA